MNFSFEQSIPWDLIISFLQNDISAEEDVQLQAWLSSSYENQQFFDQVIQTWTEGISDYAVYRAEDETVAWNALRLKIENKGNQENAKDTVVKGNFNKSRIVLLRWASAAAILILIAGVLIWFNAGKKNLIYQTGKNEQQKILLPDGSSIQLYADSRIELMKDYNKSVRVINFKRGKAFFEVIHNEQIPFVVDMVAASVQDIGTSFYIYNSTDSMHVSVKSGEVEFINKASNKTNKLSAGMSLKFLITTKNAQPVIEIDSILMDNQILLHFEKDLLSDVVFRMQKVFNKKILIIDTIIAQKRFTANLGGQSFEGAMEILSKSLGIKYYKENDVYYLKSE